MEGGRISGRQAVFLIWNFVIASAILLIPGATIAEAKQDAWIAMILAMAAGLVIAVVYTALGTRFPDQTFIQYSEKVLGKVLGKAVGLFFIWFAIQLGSLVARNFGDVFTVALLPETPLMVFNLLIILMAAYAVRGGLEVIARANDFMIPIVIGAILGVYFLVLSTPGLFRPQNLQPVFEGGIVPVLKGAYPAIGFPFGETILFTMTIPYLNRTREARWAYPLGLILGGAILLLTIVITIMALGISLASGTVYPTLTVVRLISVAQFVERLEPLLLIAWLLSGFLKIAICLYAGSLGLAQWLNLKDCRPLVLPLAALMVPFSIHFYESIPQEIFFATKIWTIYALPIEFLVPLLMLGVATLRGMGKGRGNHPGQGDG